MRYASVSRANVSFGQVKFRSYPNGLWVQDESVQSDASFKQFLKKMVTNNHCPGDDNIGFFGLTPGTGLFKLGSHHVLCCQL